MDIDLFKEAEVFGKRAKERVENGHVPDLRCVKPCDWFYNNPWRRPYLVDMIFGRYLKFSLSNLTAGTDKTLLEIGSGVGHMSLEFARHGFHVTGLELSDGAVEIAKKFARQNPYLEGFGSLEYVVSDFLTWQPTAKFDNVCIFGSLHHFSDVSTVLSKIKDLLDTNGRVIVVEPARDWVSKQDMTMSMLIRWMLSINGAWYEDIALPKSQDEIETAVNDCHKEHQEARDLDDSIQSPHDNSAFGNEMLNALRNHFDEISFEPGLSSFYRICGGIRAQSEGKAKEIAEFLHLFDTYAISNGIVKPSGFLWAGKQHG